MSGVLWRPANCVVTKDSDFHAVRGLALGHRKLGVVRGVVGATDFVHSEAALDAAGVNEPTSHEPVTASGQGAAWRQAN